MADGASSAVDATFPGPAAARPAERRKNTGKADQFRGPTSETARSTTSANVPFDWAAENSSVVPARFRNRSTGKPATTVFVLISTPNHGATYAPRIQAAAKAPKPTFKDVTQLSASTATSTVSETVAKSMNHR